MKFNKLEFMSSILKPIICFKNNILATFFNLSEKLRFIITGSYNVVFGIVLFSTFYILLNNVLHYLIIAGICFAFSIIHNFLTLKIFVFRTKKNYTQEFLRSSLVYILIHILYLFSLFLLVDITRIHPITANIILALLFSVASYILHKHYSFSKIC
jgi:putative flippase GtrA